MLGKKLLGLIQKYVRFMIVAAVLGVASLLLLESIGLLFPYDSPLIHGAMVSVIYLAGVVINFQLQKNWVFTVQNRVSFVQYAGWMITSACIVGVIAGFLFDLLNDYWPGLPFVASISLVLALLLNSPVTFLGVSFLMSRK